MPEILTESFCERCGTRYTFESAQPKGARLKGIKTVSRGLRNFVMSDDTSMDEAMAAARNETDREATSQQLDAFHKTFNFCMSCRQYTCSNCWNEVEGRCLSCAPHLGNEVLPSPFPNLEPSNGLPFGLSVPTAEAGNGHEHVEPQAAEPMAWPTSDLMQAEEAAARTFDDVIAQHEADAAIDEAGATVDEDESFDPLARLAALDAGFAGTAPIGRADAAEAEPVDAEAVEEPIQPEPFDTDVAAVAARPVEQVVPEPSEVVAAEPDQVAAEQVAEEPVAAESVAGDSSTPDASPPAEDDERAAAAAARTSDFLNRFRPGQNLDDAIAAYERAQATDDAIAAYERTQAAADALAAQPVAADERPTPGPVAPSPEPVTLEPEPEPVAAAPEPIAPEPEPVAAAPEPIAPEPEPVAAAPEPEPTWPTAEPPAPFRLPKVAEPAASSPERDRIAASGEPQEAWTPEFEPEPEPEPIAAEVREDVVPQPTWQIMAPDTTGEPEWPAPPAWPGAAPADGLSFLGRPDQPTGGIEALWAESAREVANTGAAAPAPAGARPAGGVQPCVSCGLSLSANARFCRRCGTRQD